MRTHPSFSADVAPPPAHRHRPLGFVALALVAVSGGCSGDNDLAPAGRAAGDEAWVLFTKLSSPEGEKSYVGLTGPFAADAQFDTTKAIEVPGIASFYAPKSGGFFGVGDSEDFTITRYELSDAGALAARGRVSFANTGVAGYLGNTLAFVNESKAYYIDPAQQLIVVWDPSRMELTGEIDLSPLARPGFDLDASLFHYVLRDGKMMFAVTWSNYEQRSSSRTTGLVVIDTRRDAIARVEETDRCPGALDIVEGPEGDAYFATNIYAIRDDRAVQGVARPSCVLRVRANEETFDPAGWRSSIGTK